MISKFLDQDSFNWYHLLPNYKSIIHLENILDKLKLDNPNFLAENEDKINYDEFIGHKWVYRTENGKVYALVFVTSQAVELMVLKDLEAGKKLIKIVEEN